MVKSFCPASLSRDALAKRAFSLGFVPGPGVSDSRLLILASIAPLTHGGASNKKESAVVSSAASGAPTAEAP